MKNEILYVVGGRSFSSKEPGRKISEVMAVWSRLGFIVHSQFGKDISSRRNEERQYGSQRHYDAKYRKIKWLSFFINSFSEIKDIIHDYLLYKTIFKKNKNIDLKLVWERSSRLHLAGLKFAKAKKIPFVLEWKDHLVDYNCSLFRRLALYYEDKKLAKADYVVVESQVLKEELIKLGVASKKIKVALNGVDPSEFNRQIEEGKKLKQSLGIPPEDIVIGYLGSYAFYHNTSILVKAAKEILKQNSNISFVLIGNGKEFHDCKRLSEEYRLQDNKFYMLNGVSKEIVPFYLSMMDITVLPGSTDIICPIKVMEYMAAETVAIVPDFPCNKEVILDGFNGILFEPGNVIDLQNKIMEISKNQPKIREISLNAKAYVSRHLIWEETWGSVLMKILKNGDCPSIG